MQYVFFTYFIVTAPAVLWAMWRIVLMAGYEDADNDDWRAIVLPAAIILWWLFVDFAFVLWKSLSG